MSGRLKVAPGASPGYESLQIILSPFRGGTDRLSHPLRRKTAGAKDGAPTLGGAWKGRATADFP